MNVANLLGLASEALPTPGVPAPTETAGAGRPFTALLADALDEGGETGTLAAAGLLAGEPLAIQAASAPATSSPAVPEQPVLDAADPDADDRQALAAVAAMPGSLFPMPPLPPSLSDAPLDLPQAGLSAWPTPSLSQAAPEAALGVETLPGGPPPGPAIKPAALALASASAAVAAAETGVGQKLAEVPVTLRPLADAPPLLTVPVDVRAAASAAASAGAASAAVGAAATGLAAHALPAGTPMATPASRRADAAPATAGSDAEPRLATLAATSAQSALGLAAAVRPAPAPVAPAAAAAPTADGELPSVAGSAEAPTLGESAPEAQRSEPAPLRQAATDARNWSALAGGRAGGPAGLEAAEAMAPAPEAPALPIQELPERALRIASELRADGAKHYRADLQLDPPGLGRVRIEIEMSVQETGDAERSLTRITVESAAAHEQLQAELPRLRALLAEQGLGEAQVELHLRQDQGGGPGTEEQQAQRSLRQGGEGDERERSGRRLEWRSTHDGLIDLRA